jgi:hypothetical protein
MDSKTAFTWLACRWKPLLRSYQWQQGCVLLQSLQLLFLSEVPQSRNTVTKGRQLIVHRCCESDGCNSLLSFV